MAILAGIDESGVGPRLGPLVAASATFRGPAEGLGESLWELLAPALGVGGQGLLVADSKALYHGLRDRAGFRRLEHAALAFLGAGEGVPGTLVELLQRVSAPVAGERERCPWYQLDGMTLPRAADGAEVRRDSERLAARLGEVGLKPPQIACEVVDERAFNRLVTDTGGKGQLLLHVDGRLLRRLPAESGQVYLDRLGGRRRYGPWLEEVFTQAFVWIRGEDALLSRYGVAREDGVSLEVIVAVGCEARSFPVALASMVAKYVRELHMEALNRFWAQRVPRLVPTAGYPADAARFVGDIFDAAQAEGLSVRDLVRWR